MEGKKKREEKMNTVQSDMVAAADEQAGKEETEQNRVSEDVLERRKEQLSGIHRQYGMPNFPTEQEESGNDGAVPVNADERLKRRMAQVDAINAQLGTTPQGMMQNFMNRERAQANKPKVITKEVVAAALKTLEDYRKGKENLENRIVENECWFRLQHWEQLRNKSGNNNIPASGWVFNSLANKHADMMDNYPECICLPQEESDRETAKILQSIIPVVLEQADFEKIYSDAAWDKIKTGTAVYGVFWDPRAQNGIGEIAVRTVDMLSLFWEPGITDLQKSQNVFTVELWNNNALKEAFPNEIGDQALSTPSVDIAKYYYDDSIDTADKSAVVDWYYKKNINGKTVLCYAKFVNDIVLYASEDDMNLSEIGQSYYNHGLYPFVVDRLYPEVGTIAGFGFIDVMKDNAINIDRLNAVIVRNAEQGAMRRYFVRSGASINEAEFADWTKPLIHVTDGQLGTEAMREYTPVELSGAYIQVLQNKVDELKETSFNRDVSQGSTGQGVTSGAAISALQEAGSKTSRDIIRSGYRACCNVYKLVIELMRQFYNTPRVFRITGEKGEPQFVEFDNSNLAPQQQGTVGDLDFGSRMPVFDIKVKATKQNPFSRVAANQDAINYFSMGFFNPAMADQALACMEMMDFEGKEQMREIIAKNGGMAQQIAQLQTVVAKMAERIDALDGTNLQEGIYADGYMGQEPQERQAPAKKLASTGNEAPTVRAAKERTAAHTEV